MKKGVGPKKQSITSSKQQRKLTHNSNYVNLSNEQYLMRTLKLLGVNEQEYLKQTKLSLSNQIFPKNTLNPSNSKQFFYIVISCMKYLLNQEDFANLKMWYPPKNVNEQIEFKKVLYKILQRLEVQGLIPKNMILSKSVIMGDSPVHSIIQFLRILSEMSLRTLYIQKFSKEERLIQVGLISPIAGQAPENDINKFYVFPFVEEKTVSQPPIKSIDQLQTIKQTFSVYIERFRKKILNLRTVSDRKDELINPQEIMSKFLEQKQLSQTLNTKVPKNVLSENRAFDRRIILDKNAQIWKELMKIECNFIEKNDTPVLKIQGQIDKILAEWKTVKGINKLRDFNKISEKSALLKQACAAKIIQFKYLSQQIMDCVQHIN